MLMLALRLFLKDKGRGKHHCLISFVCSNLGVETFFKDGTSENDVLRQLHILCIEVSRKFFVKPDCFLIVFLVIKGIVKALFSFIQWLLNFSDLPNHGSNSRKRYTLRLLSKCLVRNTLLPIGGNVPPTLWYPLWFP